MGVSQNAVPFGPLAMHGYHKGGLRFSRSVRAGIAKRQIQRVVFWD